MIIRSLTQKFYIVALFILVSALVLSFCAAQKDNNDSDEDGLLDSWEIEYFGNITYYGSSEDPDGDELTNLEEFNSNTNPTIADTDDDGMVDGWEVTNSLDPNNKNDAAADPDKDGSPNLDEYIHGTDPNDSNDTGPTDTKEDDDGLAMKFDSSPIWLLLLFGVPTVVILIAIIFVYTKMRREQLLEHKVRAQIFDYINQNPGVHYRGIMNDLTLHLGVLTHHLNMIEQEQYIKSLQDGMYRRFYPKNAVVKTGLILTDVQERILRTIQATPGISQSGIARNLKLTKTVVNYQVKILSNAGFVHMETVGRESQCYYLDGLDLDTPKSADA